MPRFSLDACLEINGWKARTEALDPGVFQFLANTVSSMDFDDCFTKESAESTMLGRMVLSPKKMNGHLKRHFRERNYHPYRTETFNSADEDLQKLIRDYPLAEQRRLMLARGVKPLPGFKESDFYAFSNIFEVQFGKYSFVAADLLKIMEFIESGVAETGAIILPMKSIQKKMSSGPAYYEGVMSDFIRRRMDRTIKSPIALIGIGIHEES